MSCPPSHSDTTTTTNTTVEATSVLNTTSPRLRASRRRLGVGSWSFSAMLHRLQRGPQEVEHPVLGPKKILQRLIHEEQEEQHHQMREQALQRLRKDEHIELRRHPAHQAHAQLYQQQHHD